MNTLFNLCLMLLNLYSYLIIAYFIFSWLYSLNMLANAPLFLHNIARAIYSFIEPALNKIRSFLPTARSGVDFSPFILYLIIWVLRSLLLEYGSKYLF